MAQAIVFDFNPQQTPLVAGPSVVAQVAYGDDGPQNGSDPELYAGDPSGNGSAARAYWGGTTNADGSWTSGEISVELSIPPAGGVDELQFTVDGAIGGSVYYSLPANHGDINSVSVASGAMVGGSVAWSNVSVNFGSGSAGTIVDSYSSATGPAVDGATVDASGGEEMLTVTPAAESESVVVTGDFQFTVPAGCYPGPTDLFGQIYVGMAS